MARRSLPLLVAAGGLLVLVLTAALPDPSTGAASAGGEPRLADAALAPGAPAPAVALLGALTAPAVDCKPAGPWGASLAAAGLRADGALLLDVVLRPRLPHDGLAWALTLPAGTALLAGATHGTLPAGAAPGAEHRVRLALRLPAGLASGSLALDVGPLRGVGPTSTREIDFGAPPAVGERTLLRADTGAALPALVLPATTRPGR